MKMTACQNDLDFSLLRTFLAVVRCGSMGRAATAVCRTQPAVSQQMSRLEKIVGKKVFSRTKGGVKLTLHGEMLVPYANRALQLSEEALSRLREESASGLDRTAVSENAAGRPPGVPEKSTRAQVPMEAASTTSLYPTTSANGSALHGYEGVASPVEDVRPQWSDPS
jgi:molybdenum-dependent DNA-binding transcriptional regulator ModE